MSLKEYVQASFGADAEERVLRFLLEEELAGCGDDALRWLRLFELCGQWRKQFLLWEEDTFIDGINGWNLCMGAYQLHLPDGDDWTAYLYRMTQLAVVSGMSAGERGGMVEGGRRYHNFSAAADDFYVNGGYADLTREQWLGELAGLLEHSWKRYQRFPGDNPAYHRAMEENYPKFRSVLERLEQDTEICEVVRMNRHGGGETVWYFARTPESFYLMTLKDSM